jgi:hypothetical protein
MSALPEEVDPEKIAESQRDLARLFVALRPMNGFGGERFLCRMRANAAAEDARNAYEPLRIAAETAFEATGYADQMFARFGRNRKLFDISMLVDSAHNERIDAIWEQKSHLRDDYSTSASLIEDDGLFANVVHTFSASIYTRMNSGIEGSISFTPERLRDNFSAGVQRAKKFEKTWWQRLHLPFSKQLTTGDALLEAHSAIDSWTSTLVAYGYAVRSAIEAHKIVQWVEETAPRFGIDLSASDHDVKIAIEVAGAAIDHVQWATVRDGASVATLDSMFSELRFVINE